MKKKLLLILSMILITATLNTAFAKNGSQNGLTDAIKMYKTGNYTECYATLNQYVKTKPDSALAYYYLAMAASQIGRSDEAASNYQRVLNLTQENTTLHRYASKGKICIESPSSCHEDTSSEFDDFIKDKFKSKFSSEVRSEYERLKLENMMREMNRSNDITPQRFKEFRDFSSMNTDEAPTNDEIVAAIRILQKAGIGNFNDNALSSLSLLTNTTDSQTPILNMLNRTNLSPQVLQTLFTNNMSLGF